MTLKDDLKAVDISNIAVTNNGTQYACKLSSIGKFYKPNNKSNLNQLNNTDKESLIYLLEFLQRKGILELKENLNERNVYDRLADVLIEWDTLNI